MIAAMTMTPPRRRPRRPAPSPPRGSIQPPQLLQHFGDNEDYSVDRNRRVRFLDEDNKEDDVTSRKRMDPPPTTTIHSDDAQSRNDNRSNRPKWKQFWFHMKVPSLQNCRPKSKDHHAKQNHVPSKNHNHHTSNLDGSNMENNRLDDGITMDSDMPRRTSLDAIGISTAAFCYNAFGESNSYSNIKSKPDPNSNSNVRTSTNRRTAVTHSHPNSRRSIEYTESEELFREKAAVGTHPYRASFEENEEYARMILATKWTYSTDMYFDHARCSNTNLNQNIKLPNIHESNTRIKPNVQTKPVVPRAKETEVTVMQRKIGVVVLQESCLTSALELSNSLASDTALEIVLIAAASFGLELLNEENMELRNHIGNNNIEIHFIDDENCLIDVYELAKVMKGCKKIFFGVNVWNTFTSFIEENYAKILLKAAYLCNIRSVVFTSYEDTDSNFNGNHSNCVPSTSTTVQKSIENDCSPSFVGMKDVLDYAESVDIEIHHTATLVSSKTGKYMNVTYKKDESLQANTGMLPGFESLDETDSITTISSKETVELFRRQDKHHDRTSKDMLAVEGRTREIEKDVSV